jgi:hypothetical protein
MNLRVLRRKVNWVWSVISTTAGMTKEVDTKFILSFVVNKNNLVTRHVWCFDNCVGVLVICVFLFAVFLPPSENSIAVNNNNNNTNMNFWHCGSYCVWGFFRLGRSLFIFSIELCWYISGITFSDSDCIPMICLARHIFSFTFHRYAAWNVSCYCFKDIREYYALDNTPYLETYFYTGKLSDGVGGP